ncbi:FHA domain-containing protein [Arthrobacter mobilis]|uniref:FHA domain-containing protein n=1 Tax=Arthrobacter mobilis TaxID=2724944 RepID=A0A7X6HCE7_9MICC|nr:FHA domain-containing protein [Arthrobacter mobilis]NKX53346.1 FHA domain-containing protein [Arthrobacter mobilis]
MTAGTGPAGGNSFVTARGTPGPKVIVIPAGRASVGRGPDVSVRLDFDGVSRHHANLETYRGRTTLTDAGSRNGTWVNGTRITGPVLLSHGDVVQFGTLRLQFREPVARPVAGPATVAPAKEGSGLGTTLLVAGACEAVVLLGNVAATFFAGWTGTLSWLVAPVVAVLVAMGKVLVEHFGKRQSPEPVTRETGPYRPAAGADPYSGAAGPAPVRRPVVPALAAIVLVLGVGGLAVTAGVRFVTGWLTGNEPGVERLVETASNDIGGIVLTVDSVRNTRHFTRVGVTVRNGLSHSITLPLFGNAYLTDQDGKTLEADPGRSDWSETIVPGGFRRGTLVFPGHVRGSDTTVSLSFATVFGHGFGGPPSLELGGIRLDEVPEGGPGARPAANLLPAGSQGGRLARVHEAAGENDLLLLAALNDAGVTHR